MSADEIFDLDLNHKDDFKKTLVDGFSGLYFLYDKDKVLLYIGKSSFSVKNRVHYHLFKCNENRFYFGHNKFFYIKKRDYYTYFSFKKIDGELLHSLEQSLIQKLNPIFNIEFNNNYDLLEYFKNPEWKYLEKDHARYIFPNHEERIKDIEVEIKNLEIELHTLKKEMGYK